MSSSIILFTKIQAMSKSQMVIPALRTVHWHYWIILILRISIFIKKTRFEDLVFVFAKYWILFLEIWFLKNIRSNTTKQKREMFKYRIKLFMFLWNSLPYSRNYLFCLFYSRQNLWLLYISPIQLINTFISEIGQTRTDLRQWHWFYENIFRLFK